MKIAICDDEKVWLDFVEKIIEDYLTLNQNEKVLEVVKFLSGESLLRYEEKFDLIFLDQEMEGINGIETAKRLRKFDHDVKIVFITGHTYIMQKAFHVNAYRFLEKQLEKENIESCLDDFFNEIKNEKYIEIEVLGVMVAIKQKNIMYITTMRNSTMINCNNEKFVSKYSLKYYNETLDHELFYKCRRNIIVNISYIDWIDEHIVLFGGKKITYSYRRKAELKYLYTKYLVKYAR